MASCSFLRKVLVHFQQGSGGSGIIYNSFRSAVIWDSRLQVVIGEFNSQVQLYLSVRGQAAVASVACL